MAKKHVVRHEGSAHLERIRDLWARLEGVKVRSHEYIDLVQQIRAEADAHMAGTQPVPPPGPDSHASSRN